MNIMVAERLLLTTLLAITLFVGGIVLLISKIPFWSLYFGLPSVQIGIILMILAFEKTSKEKFGHELDKEIAPRDTKNSKSIKASEE